MIGKTNDCIMYLLQQERDKQFEVKPYKQARTNRQNAYYWVLLTQVADAMRMSKIECHNRMLRDYGQPCIIDGEVIYAMLPDTEDTERGTLRSETYHLRPTSQTRTGAEHGYRAYMLLRGSHEYNTAEMTVLLDGLIQEAKALGVETATPDELARMREYDKSHEEKRLKKRDTA